LEADFAGQCAANKSTSTKNSDGDVSIVSLSAADSELKENICDNAGIYAASIQQSPEIEPLHVGSESDDELPFVPHQKNFILSEGVKIDDIDDIIRRQVPVTEPEEGDEFQARMEQLEAELAAERKKIAENKKADEEFVFHTNTLHKQNENVSPSLTMTILSSCTGIEIPSAE
jgi:hypothetical protein